MTVTTLPLQLPTEETFWFRFAYHGSMGQLGPMEGCNEGLCQPVSLFQKAHGNNTLSNNKGAKARVSNCFQLTSYQFHMKTLTTSCLSVSDW